MAELIADLKNAEVVLRVPYKRPDTFDPNPVMRQVAVRLTDLIEVIASQLEGEAFGREDSVTIRRSSWSSDIYIASVPPWWHPELEA